MQIDVKNILKICSSLPSIVTMILIFKIALTTERSKKKKTSLYNPLYNLQHYIWNHQGKKPYEGFCNSKFLVTTINMNVIWKACQILKCNQSQLQINYDNWSLQAKEIILT